MQPKYTVSLSCLPLMRTCVCFSVIFVFDIRHEPDIPRPEMMRLSFFKKKRRTFPWREIFSITSPFFSAQSLSFTTPSETSEYVRDSTTRGRQGVSWDFIVSTSGSSGMEYLFVIIFHSLYFSVALTFVQIFYQMSNVCSQINFFDTKNLLTFD